MSGPASVIRYDKLTALGSVTQKLLGKGRTANFCDSCRRGLVNSTDVNDSFQQCNYRAREYWRKLVIQAENPLAGASGAAGCCSLSEWGLKE